MKFLKDHWKVLIAFPYYTLRYAYKGILIATLPWRARVSGTDDSFAEERQKIARVYAAMNALKFKETGRSPYDA